MKSQPAFLIGPVRTDRIRTWNARPMNRDVWLPSVYGTEMDTEQTRTMTVKPHPALSGALVQHLMDDLELIQVFKALLRCTVHG